MGWYWYVLIVVGVIGLGAVKLIVWKNMNKKKAEKASKKNKIEED